MEETRTGNVVAHEPQQQQIELPKPDPSTKEGQKEILAEEIQKVIEHCRVCDAQIADLNRSKERLLVVAEVLQNHRDSL